MRPSHWPDLHLIIPNDIGQSESYLSAIVTSAPRVEFFQVCHTELTNHQSPFSTASTVQQDEAANDADDEMDRLAEERFLPAGLLSSAVENRDERKPAIVPDSTSSSTMAENGSNVSQTTPMDSSTPIRSSNSPDEQTTRKTSETRSDASMGVGTRTLRVMNPDPSDGESHGVLHSGRPSSQVTETSRATVVPPWRTGRTILSERSGPGPIGSRINGSIWAPASAATSDNWRRSTSHSQSSSEIAALEAQVAEYNRQLAQLRAKLDTANAGNAELRADYARLLTLNQGWYLYSQNQAEVIARLTQHITGETQSTAGLAQENRELKAHIVGQQQAIDAGQRARRDAIALQSELTTRQQEIEKTRDNLKQRSGELTFAQRERDIAQGDRDIAQRDNLRMMEKVERLEREVRWLREERNVRLGSQARPI